MLGFDLSEWEKEKNRFRVKCVIKTAALAGKYIFKKKVILKAFLYNVGWQVVAVVYNSASKNNVHTD